MIEKINGLKNISLGPDLIGIAPASRFDKMTRYLKFCLKQSLLYVFATEFCEEHTEE